MSASESLRKVIGVARTPADQAGHDTCFASVRSQLDETTFATAWAEACTMDFKQAVAYALEQPEDG